MKYTKILHDEFKKLRNNATFDWKIQEKTFQSVFVRKLEQHIINLERNSTTYYAKIQK